MSPSMKEPSRTLLGGGVIVAAVLAVAGGFLFFANVPERGSARDQILAAAPPMERAAIDEIIAQRNAMAPRPSAVAAIESEAVSRTLARARVEKLPIAGMAAAGEAASADLAAGSAPPPSPAAEGEELYRKGLYPEALAHWKAAAEAGDRRSAYLLGVEYIDGKSNVVGRDYAEGEKWIGQAAEAGEPAAQFEMGSLYEHGLGVERDIAIAAGWYLKAAERGHPQAQYNVATMLEAGEGLKTDRIEALKYFTLAARQGFQGPVEPGAEPPGAQLRKALSPEDAAEADRRTEAFEPITD